MHSEFLQIPWIAAHVTLQSSLLCKTKLQFTSDRSQVISDFYRTKNLLQADSVPVFSSTSCLWHTFSLSQFKSLLAMHVDIAEREIFQHFCFFPTTSFQQNNCLKTAMNAVKVSINYHIHRKHTGDSSQAATLSL